jgi:hypothetical protein
VARETQNKIFKSFILFPLDCDGENKTFSLKHTYKKKTECPGRRLSYEGGEEKGIS